MRTTRILAIPVALALLGAVGCKTSSTSFPSGPAVYTQIERLSRPAVKEAFENFSDHDTTNRSSPYDSTTDAKLFGSIGTFMTAVAGRSAAWSGAMQSVLIPDEMQADLSKTSVPAAYLGIETGGATGSLFGGRALTDDVIAISLGAVFGNTLSALGVVPDDGKESYCLSNDNVAPTGKHFTATFPYVGAPR